MARSIASAALIFTADVSDVAAKVKRAKSDIAGLDKAARAVGKDAGRVRGPDLGLAGLRHP